MTNKKNTLGKLIQYFSYTLVLLNSVGAMEGDLGRASGSDRYNTPPRRDGSVFPFTPPPRTSRNAITALSTPPPAPKNTPPLSGFNLLNDCDRDEIQHLILLLFNENIRTLRAISRRCDVSTPISQLSGLPLAQYLFDAEGLYALQQEVDAFFQNLKSSDPLRDLHNFVRKIFIALQKDNPRGYESYFERRRDEPGSRVPLMGNLGNAKIFRRVLQKWCKSRKNEEVGAQCGSIARFGIPNDLPPQPPAWPSRLTFEAPSRTPDLAQLL